MIWKFWFILSAVFLALLSVIGIGYNNSASNEGNAEYIIYFLTGVMYIICMGYFYALGWNKKLYSEKFHKSFSHIVYCVIIILPLLFSAYSGFVTSMVNTILFVIVSSPVWIAIIKYDCTRLKQLDPVDNIFWKILTLVVVVGCAMSFVEAFAINFKHLSTSYNAWDIYNIFTYVYTAIFLTGFAYKRKLFTQAFWKISSIPYAISLVPATLFASQQFKIDNAIRLDLWSHNVITILMTVLFLYALYKYSFTNAVFKSEHRMQSS